MDDNEIISLMKEMFIEENFNPKIDLNDNKKENNNLMIESMRKEAIAEKLLSFKLNDDDNDNEGRVYSLVRVIQLSIIIGRNDPNPEYDNVRKLLLTNDELDYVVPRIEFTHREEFEKYGLLLPSSSSSSSSP